jgi:hypothetical protein
MSQSSSPASSRKWFAVGIAVSLSAATFAKPISSKMDQPWHEQENPDSIGLPLRHRLGEIFNGPLRQAEVKRVPWTSSFWPTFKGSIAHRPSDGPNTAWGSNAPGLHHELLDGDALAASATQSEKDPSDPSITIYSGGALDRLSPSELLDVSAGRADSRLGQGEFYKNTVTIRDWSRSVMREAPHERNWHGLCNGFAAASIHTSEPKPADFFSSVYTGANGKKFRFRVRFGSGDLKALASYQYAWKTWDAEYSGFHQVGLSNCDRASGVGCRGLNAGSFHLLMTNIVGMRRESLVFDADSTQAFWNYPVVGYEITSMSLRPYRNADGTPTQWMRRDADARATHDVRIVMNAHFMNESDWNRYPFIKQGRNKIFTRTYDYLVEANAGPDGKAGNADDVVFGGEWLSQDRPHFAWRLDAPIRYEGDFKILDLIWSDASQK